MPAKLPEIHLSRKARIWIGVAITATSLIAAALVVLFAIRGMFGKNPLFTVRDLQVESQGWWKGKAKEVSAILGIVKGKNNLFELDLSKKRERLEKESAIEKVTIARELPDRIVVKIVERIPRALLISPYSPFVMDSASVVMQRDKCMNIAGSLPVIIGFREPIPSFGSRFERVSDAINLIMLTVADFTDIRIASINARDKNYLYFCMFYRGNTQDLFRVYIPVKDLRGNLNKLYSVLENMNRTKELRRIIDLRYEGRAVLKQKP